MAPADAIHVVHVLISYRGARRAPADLERTPEQARRLAEHLLQRACAAEPLSEIATAWSDEPYGRKHRGLVSLPRHCMFLPFTPAYELAVGAVGELVESDYGFHILQRLR